MREIKFRAWDLDNQRMIDSKDLIFHEYTEVYDHFSQDDKSFMQYVGLKDKSGVDIYENDVVRILYTDWPSNPAPNNEGLEEYKKSISHIGQVVFSNLDGVAEFEIMFDNGAGNLRPGTHGEIEVIGNIYQNPELITQTLNCLPTEV